VRGLTIQVGKLNYVKMWKAIPEAVMARGLRYWRRENSCPDDIDSTEYG
jgi:hypothetical protein